MINRITYSFSFFCAITLRAHFSILINTKGKKNPEITLFIFSFQTKKNKEKAFGEIGVLKVKKEEQRIKPNDRC